MTKLKWSLVKKKKRFGHFEDEVAYARNRDGILYGQERPPCRSDFWAVTGMVRRSWCILLRTESHSLKPFQEGRRSSVWNGSCFPGGYTPEARLAGAEVPHLICDVVAENFQFSWSCVSLKDDSQFERWPWTNCQRGLPE